MAGDLRIAARFSLPPDYVTQRVGVLGTSGGGKSNLAAVIVEGLYRAKLPFAVVDPEGSWYGLRSSRDGKSPGLEVVIFGGDHADVPLEQGSGPEVARFLAEQHVSCVLDVSEMSESAKVRWLAEFGRELYRRNRDPYHLVLEEADEYLMQRPIRKDQVACLSVWQHLVKRGRKRGLGVTLITQRSATLNKDVLTQIGSLFVFRTTAPQDRKAIAAWLEFQAQSKDVLESLPKLKDGECWVWSPQWLGTMKRFQANLRATFDSGATPKGGKSRPAATLADVDLEGVAKRFAASIEKAKEDDPKELRKEIAKLRGDVSRLEKEKSVTPTKVVEVPVLDEKTLVVLQVVSSDLRALWEGYHQELAKKVAGVSEEVTRLGGQVLEVVEPIRGPLNAALAKLGRYDGKASERPSTPEPDRRRAARSGDFARTHGDLHVVLDAASDGGAVRASEGLTKPEQRILDSLAWWEAAGHEQVTRQQAAFVARYTVNGHFNNTVGGLNTKGLVSYPSPGFLSLTPEGSAGRGKVWIGEPSREDLISRVRDVLRGEPQRRIFDALLLRGPEMSREELASEAGYTVNGHFNNTVGGLSSIGVVHYPRPGYVGLADWI